jgi:hypothetical protein
MKIKARAIRLQNTWTIQVARSAGTPFKQHVASQSCGTLRRIVRIKKTDAS